MRSPAKVYSQSLNFCYAIEKEIGLTSKDEHRAVLWGTKKKTYIEFFFPHKEKNVITCKITMKETLRNPDVCFKSMCSRDAVIYYVPAEYC